MASKDKYDLDAMSVSELTALISEAENKRREKTEDAKNALLAEMQERAAGLGLSLDDLMGRPTLNVPSEAPKGRKPRKDAGTPVSAKYRGPNGEEWSGRGRPPTWLTALEAAGKHRDEFRI